MSWGICLVLAILAVVAGSCLYFRGRRKTKSFWKLGIGVYVACVFICLPAFLLEENKVAGAGAPAFFAVLKSLSHSIRMFVVDTGVSDITGSLEEAFEGNFSFFPFYLYKFVTSALYVGAPLFTLSFVLSHVSSFFGRGAVWRRGFCGHDLYYFSELNDRALTTAKNALKTTEKNGKKKDVIFCGKREKAEENAELFESAREIGAIFVDRDMEHIAESSRSRGAEVFFEISDSDDENLRNTIDLIHRLRKRGRDRKQKKNTEIYCYAETTEAETLIDAEDKGNLRVLVVDETREAVFRYLSEHPLYEGLVPGRDNRICLLIVGGGKTGTEFLRAAVWCGQMKDVGLEIHLIDIKGNLVRKKLEMNLPEVMNGTYDISVYKGNIFNSPAEEYLERIADRVTGCVVALGSDEENIRASLFLCRYFGRRSLGVPPQICTRTFSSERTQAVWEMHENMNIGPCKGKPLYYGITPVLAEGQIFDSRDEGFLLEYLGLGIHLSYYFGEDVPAGGDPEETKKYRENVEGAVHAYFDRQENRRSSIASGLHLRYKLWQLGYAILRVPEKEAQEEKALYDRFIKPVSFAGIPERELEPFFSLEHDRWMAFTRSNGWRLASSGEGDDSLEAVLKCWSGYHGQFKNQNYLLRLHPALVAESAPEPERADLYKLDDAMGTGYVESDRKLVSRGGDIVAGKWFTGLGEMTVMGRSLQQDLFVIAPLEEAAKYEMALLELSEKRGGEGSGRAFQEHMAQLRSSCIGALRSARCPEEKKEECRKLLQKAAEKEGRGEDRRRTG